MCLQYRFDLDNLDRITYLQPKKIITLVQASYHLVFFLHLKNMDCPIEYTRYEEPAPSAFLDIPFYIDFDSIIGKSTYCFENIDSLNVFRQHKDSKSKDSFNFEYIKIVNNKVSGLPLYECKFKKDKSYLLNDSQKNFVIKKYVALSPLQNPKDNYEYLGFNDKLKLSIFRYEYAVIKNKGSPFSIENKRIYSNNLSDGSTMNMKFNSNFNSDKNVEVSIGSENMTWKHGKNKNESILFKNIENRIALVDTTVNLNYDKEILGLLKLTDFDNTSNQDKHSNHGVMNFENEKIIISCFILLLQKRYDVSSRVGTVKGLH